jgi:hypothetical protein
MKLEVWNHPDDWDALMDQLTSGAPASITEITIAPELGECLTRAYPHLTEQSVGWNLRGIPIRVADVAPVDTIEVHYAGRRGTPLTRLDKIDNLLRGEPA